MSICDSLLQRVWKSSSNRFSRMTSVAVDPRLNVSDFDFELPQELIAQEPITPRDSSRMLVLSRASGDITHARVRDLASYLRPGDLLVANNSRVLPARFWVRKIDTGARVELLLLRA